MLDNQPRPADLHALIAKVKSYPISAKELVELAMRERAPHEVIEFYQAFHDDEVFDNQDDLVARSEHVEIMNRDRPPQEILTSPEED